MSKKYLNTSIYFEWIYCINIILLPNLYYNIFYFLWFWYTGWIHLMKEGQLWFAYITTTYLVMYHWKSLITQKIMLLRKDFYDIPSRNGSLSKLTSCLAWKGYHYRHGYLACCYFWHTYKLHHSFLYLAI